MYCTVKSCYMTLPRVYSGYFGLIYVRLLLVLDCVAYGIRYSTKFHVPVEINCIPLIPFLYFYFLYSFMHAFIVLQCSELFCVVSHCRSVVLGYLAIGLYSFIAPLNVPKRKLTRIFMPNNQLRKMKDSLWCNIFQR